MNADATFLFLFNVLLAIVTADVPSPNGQLGFEGMPPLPLTLPIQRRCRTEALSLKPEA